MNKRALMEAVAAYAVFCALGWLSRSLPGMFLVFVLFGILFPLVWVGFTRRWKDIGFRKDNAGKALLWGFLVGLAWVLYTYIAFREDGAPSSLLGIQLLIGFPVWLLIMSPFQEFFFRGWLQPRVQSALGKWPGLLVSALAFTAWHFFPPLEGTTTSSLPLTSPVGVASTFLLGILMGMLYQRWENILSPWLAHAIAGMGLVLIGRMTFVQMLP